MEPGTQLGHYEILSALGKGGMGEVWRARDSKLGREVAIKTLPEEFAQDEERLARFEREAKLLASLNHPNIAAIYGLEEDNGTRFLVLELVEGDTLADRLKRGAIPVEESLKLALQIAEALEAAHEKGVIHMDLKPANIKVTPDGKIKVLDFGLAKAFAGDSNVDLSQSPTLSAAPTQQGIILGTAAYMSPEQARGQEVDKRADIWAFGCVVHEMLTGRGTFDGGTVSDVLAGVLRADPDWKGLPLNLHPRIRLLLERCLEKDSRDRYHDIADVRVDIQKVLADPTGVIIRPVDDEVQEQPRPRLPWMVGAVVLTAIIAITATWNLKPPAPRLVARSSHVLPEGQVFTRSGRSLVAVSPDGTSIVYVANSRLYLRNLNELESRPIQGTDENPTSPFFSPDGQWIGYYSGGQLKKIAISGGAPVVVCAATNPFGASWGADDTIVFGQPEGIMRVSADGGTPELIIEAEAAGQVHGPQVLPGGNWVLFTVTTATGQSRWDQAQIVVESLESGERKVLWSGGSDARYVPTGHLVYALEDVLFAVPFDINTLEVMGGPVSVVEAVRRAGALTGSANYAFSDGGSLAYVSGGGGGEVLRSLVWLDRDGSNAVPLSADLANYELPRISPDGTRVAFSILAEGGFDIWVYHLETGSRSQFTFEGTFDRVPVWTRDGSRIAFSRQPAAGIYWKLADGSGEAELLLEQDFNVIPVSWSPDNNVLAFYIINPGPQRDIWTLPMDDGAATSEPFLVSPADEKAPAFSPDGNWIAYVSDETGRDEVWVRPYPSTGGGQRRISTESGVEPVWSPDGRELFFRTIEGDMMAVNVDVGAGFTFELPRKLFDGQIDMNLEVPGQRGLQTYDVHPDGDRFLMVTEPQGQLTQQINIVLNWFEELKERVPVP